MLATTWICVFDKLQSRKSQAGTQVQISDLEFSLKTQFPTTHPPPGKVFVSYVEGTSLNKSCLPISVGIKDRSLYSHITQDT